ncbi:MAG: efflux RND transporter permease subunit [Xanthomonadaceae bacterium]|nr:efflux RND transporter permease subunit [Xanthomonadaceae bacterium]
MNALIALSIRHRLVLIVLMSIAMAYGLKTLLAMPLDVFPEFVPPQVTVQTEAPGMTPDQVEQRVTTPLESALGGAPGLESLRSESIAGLSVITLAFADDIDPVMARQGVAERLATVAGVLPAGVASPLMSPLTSSTMDLLKVGLVSNRLDDFALRDLAAYSLRPRLLAVPGVSRVTVFGGAVRQLQIQIDPARLRASGLALADVLATMRAALGQQGGGLIELPNQRLLLSIADPVADADAIGMTVLAGRSGRPLLLRDVADIRDGAAVAFGDALIQGRRGVLLTMSGQFGANTLTTTRAVEAALEELRPTLAAQGVQVISPLHRPANFIELALRNLGQSLLLGSLLILALLLAFLRNWRTVLISFLTIPLSLLLALLVLNAFDASVNTLTLGGFAVALGVLVDDAIIDIENIVRRLKLNAVRDAPLPFLEVVRAASVEIRGSVLYATVVVLLVFVPVLAMSGVQGRLLAPLALAFALSVMASLLVALSVTPALCALLLRDHAEVGDPRWQRRLHVHHRVALGWVDRRLRTVLVALTLLLLSALLVLPRLGGEFFPMFREGHFVLQVSSRLPGTSIAQMLQVGRAISDEAMRLPYVASIEQQVGRAERGEDTWGSHRSEFHVELKPGSRVDQVQAQQDLRRILAGYPGMQSEVLTFLGDRISETLTGETAQVVVNVVGPDLAQLDLLAAQVARVAASVPGVVDLRSRSQAAAPALAVTLDALRLGEHAVRAADALEAIATAYGGTVVGQVQRQDHRVDVVATLPSQWRERPELLAQVPLSGVDGSRTTLGQVGRIAPVEGRYSIDHDGGRRRVAVGFNVAGRSAAMVVAELRSRLARQIELPERTFLEVGGVAEAEAAARRELWLYGVLASLAIAMVVGMAFRRRVHVPMLLLNLPFALLGGILAMALTGIGLSIGSLIGLVTVFGISARNAILLLAHYEHLVCEEGEAWSAELAWRGASERLRPVLMTALATGLGLVPLALGIGRAGHEIEAPMAIVVLGGLLSSTALTMLVLPVLAARWRFNAVATGDAEQTR